jgi:hypothetical protein
MIALYPNLPPSVKGNVMFLQQGKELLFSASDDGVVLSLVDAWLYKPLLFANLASAVSSKGTLRLG